MPDSRKLLLVANTDWYLFNFRQSLAHFLRKEGFEVVFVSPGGNYAKRLVEMGFRWIEWRVGRLSIAPWEELAAMMRLEQIYRYERPTLVHHHTIKPVLYGTWAARRCGVPAVVNSITGRGYVFLSQELRARLLRPFAELFYRVILHHRGVSVVFENDVDCQYFQSHGLVVNAQAHLIRSVGVDVDLYSPAPEPDGTPVVLLASRMLWDKGVGIFAEAARLLKGKVPVRMVLVGMPDPGNPSSLTVDDLQNWVKEGIVEWWGWQEDMPAVFSTAHIVALPTMYGEGVPTTLIEGAASGRALIASDIPGCREVITHEADGLLVAAGDPQSLADAVERLALDRSLRLRLGAAARQRAVADFSDRQVNNETFAVYGQVLSEVESGH